MNWMFITNDSDIAKYIFNCKVNRVFVDLEILGKYERQGHLDTVISKHSISDIGVIKNSVPDLELLVRINPLHSNTKKEIDEVIRQGADIIMLPMFETKSDIEVVSNIIDGRVKFIPLIETKLAAENIESYVSHPGISEFYIGLNDLHRQLKNKFMFELISTGYIENLVGVIKNSGKEFGFGGIAKLGEGVLPSSLILSEHVRLGSSSVILSRSFHQRAESLDDLKDKIDLSHEIEKLNKEIIRLEARDEFEVQKDKNILCETINNILRDINEDSI